MAKKKRAAGQQQQQQQSMVTQSRGEAHLDPIAQDALKDLLEMDGPDAGGNISPESKHLSQTLRRPPKSQSSSRWLLVYSLGGLGGAVLMALFALWLARSSLRAASPQRPAATSLKSLNRSSFVVAGFLPEYRHASRDLDYLCSRTTHLILFSVEPNGATGALAETGRLDLAFERLKPEPRPCKLIVAVGGDGRSAGFGPMTASAKKRTAFVKDLVATYGDKAQGVELNWQFPRNPEEVDNLSSLVIAIKKALPKWQVSMAIPPDEGFSQVLRDSGLAELIDVFHIMAYQNGVTGVGTLAYNRALEAVEKVTGPNGVPANKSTLGIAFFSQNPSSGVVYTYEQAVESAQLYSDFEQKAPASVADQVDLAAERGLLGVSLWELGQDCRPKAVGEHKATCKEKPTLIDTVFHSVSELSKST